MQDLIRRAAEVMKNSRKTVVVTGAGISTEAGIPDFRGENGIYRQLGEDRVMRIINIDFFRHNPEEFYSFYRQYFNFPAVEPSKAHYMLARLEKEGYVAGVVTQNIDNLHQKAGSKNVIPIHGNAEQFVCQGRSCRTRYDASYVENYPETVPRCSACGSVIKPDVVLFGENIYNYADAREMILSAQLLIVIGSSLTVYPLAGFVREFCTFTQDLIIINKGPTYLDHAALLKIDTGTTGAVLEQIYQYLQQKR
ncbi:MAG TPA: Sir2 family NAD-dependent protein deacetylase [Syntrophomonadaceae bacterium]|nr:Sir2 family NAD-dependent protein deacetylase [Syntrophomonadaceae bacterium]HQA08566.1 Sir2 family NAD-dependent protein deacetylase [Syntrophomonadaceae bacterium]HQE23824.1 Sir2 family NAD-dependent protein deacetylase [Syntrophomonadaceae bacterium]